MGKEKSFLECISDIFEKKSDKGRYVICDSKGNKIGVGKIEVERKDDNVVVKKREEHYFIRNDKGEVVGHNHIIHDYTKEHGASRVVNVRTHENVNVSVKCNDNPKKGITRSIKEFADAFEKVKSSSSKESSSK